MIMVRQKLSRGTVVKVWRGLYWHFAIYLGDGEVAELAKPFEGGNVRIVSLSAFNRGSRLQVVRFAGAFSKEAVARRAESLVGSSGYDLFKWNCEHFAAWCATGFASSQQIAASKATAVVLTLLALPALFASN